MGWMLEVPLRRNLSCRHVPDFDAAMRDFSSDHRWLSINSATVRRQRGVDWPLLEIVDACAKRGIRAISPWRDQVAAAGLQPTAQALRAHGIELSGYCRGGMFTHTDAASRQAVCDDNRRALDEACTLGAPCLVLVVGGLPGALAGKAARVVYLSTTGGIAGPYDDAQNAAPGGAVEILVRRAFGNARRAIVPMGSGMPRLRTQ